MNQILKAFIFLVIMVCLIPQNVIATTYRTVSSGFWSNNNVWLNGAAPSTTTSDTIIISKFIEFTSDLEFLPGAYVRIDSSGALCGHYTITFNSNTLMHCYGILENDIFLIPGGQIYFFPDARIIWTQYATLTNGASLISTGALIEIGPWFQCLAKTAGIDEPEISFSIIAGHDGNYSIDRTHIFGFYINDMSGRIVTVDNSGANTMNLSGFVSGIYFVTVRCNEGIFRQKFFIR